MTAVPTTAALLPGAARATSRWRWIGFAALVGLNQGAVTLTLALASSIVGVQHAGFESGLLFGSYTVSALLAAVPTVRMLGAKRTACVALLVQGAYVTAYFAASVVPTVALPVCIAGSVIGGIASGMLWTAQGTYFAQFARSRALPSPTGSTSDETAILASYFASTFLCVEVAVKLIGFVALRMPEPMVSNATGNASFHVDQTGAEAAQSSSSSSSWVQQLTLAGLAIVTAACGLLAALVVPDLGAPTPPAGSEPCVEASAALELPGQTGWRDRFGRLGAALSVAAEPHALLLAPFNVTFASSSALLTNYVDAAIARPLLGISSVSIFAALLSAVAALGSFASARLSTRVGKPAVLCGACACFFALAAYLAGVEVLCIVEDREPPTRAIGDGDHASPSEGGRCTTTHGAYFGWPQLATVYALQGLGRGAWESTNRAVWADAFPSCADAAFAMLLLQFGLASTVAYALFPLLPPIASMGACAILALLAAAGAARSGCMQATERRMREDAAALGAGTAPPTRLPLSEDGRSTGSSGSDGEAAGPLTVADGAPASTSDSDAVLLHVRSQSAKLNRALSL